jgi:cytochrome c biogenesis protein CcdA
MRTSRWLELGCCLAGAAVAAFQIYHIVFDPLYTFTTSGGQHGQQSIFQRVQAGDALNDIQSIGFVTVVFLIAVFCGLIHSITGNVLSKRMLWISVAILVAYSLLGFLTIGLRLLPATALMLAAALLSLRNPAPAPS